MPVKIVFMGTPDFVLPFLKNLAEDPLFEVQAVITQEDKKVGRKQILTSPPVKILAESYQLPVLQPEKLKNNPEFINLLRSLKPDFIVVVAFGKILPKAVLDIPKYGCINFHPSLLPKYRGANPMVAALVNGDMETGISFMKLEEKMDSGPIYLIKKVPVDPEDNMVTLRLKLFLLGASLLNEILLQIVDGELVPLPQNEKMATYCGKVSKEDGMIDALKLSAAEIRNRIRAYTPWPECYILLKGKRLKIIEAEIDESMNLPAGSWKEFGKDKIALGTRTGLVFPLRVQLEGKSAMTIADFLRGYRSWLF